MTEVHEPNFAACFTRMILKAVAAKSEFQTKLLKLVFFTSLFGDTFHANRRFGNCYITDSSTFIFSPFNDQELLTKNFELTFVTSIRL